MDSKAPWFRLHFGVRPRTATRRTTLRAVYAGICYQAELGELFEGRRGKEYEVGFLQLAEGITEQDPPFLRNKIAQLWVEIAKRSWGWSRRRVDKYG